MNRVVSDIPLPLPTEAEPTADLGAERTRVLVVDDDERNLLAVATVLEDLGEVVLARSGEEALRLGFATRVSADPLAEALQMAHEIAGKSPDAIRAGKRLLNASLSQSAAELLLAESVEQKALIGSPNQVEAVKANIERRAPRFSAPA